MSTAIAAPPTRTPGTARGNYERALPPAIASEQPTKTKRAVIYLRVSTAEQASKGGDTEGYSLPAQREACYRKAKDLGAEVVDQYVDRGESAKVVDRPALQLMLHRITETADVDFVIVHKLDRFARNRTDDANLTLAIFQHGARLVSCTENIDDTPAGKLTHGILAVINQYQSDNLATEAAKGMLKKAQLGGTPGRAPIGYLNVQENINGDKVSTVARDDERAPEVEWAFRAFASGGYSLTEITDELEDRGLRTPATKKRTGGPMSKSMVARMMRDRYYLGIVTYKGIEYDGKHPALIDREVWHAVQEVLDGRLSGRTRQRTHRHYLRGNIFCAGCQRQLVFSRSRGRGGIEHDYFFCTTRRDGSCLQRHLKVEAVEEQVEEFWRRCVCLPGNLADQLRERVVKQAEAENNDLDRQMRKHRQELSKAKGENERLLDAFLAGDITKEQFTARQHKFSDKIAAAERALETCGVLWNDIAKTFEQVLYFVQHAGEAYAQAGPDVRRRLNLICFAKLLVGPSGVEGAEVTDVFANLLTDDLLTQVRVANDPEQQRPAAAAWEAAGEQVLNKFLLVPPTGFEPVLPA